MAEKDVTPEFSDKKPIYAVTERPAFNFGAYSVLSDAEYHLKETPDWYWKFRPTTSIDDLEYAKFLDAYYEDHTPRADDWLVAAWRQLAISFAGTNIPELSYLNDLTPIYEVEAIVKQMPLNLVAELWIALGKANPLYGPPPAPSAPTESEPEQTNSESLKTKSK